MKNRKLLKSVSGTLILLSSFNDIYAEETKVLNLDPFRVEIVGNRMGDADSEKLFKYAEYLYKNKRYNDALPYLKNIKEYSISHIVDDAIYTLANLHLTKIHDSVDSFDYALTLYEQMIFTYPEGNIVSEGYLKGTLENIIKFCVEYSEENKINFSVKSYDYPHAIWALGILTNYPGISELDIKNNETIVRNFLKKELPEISFKRTYLGYIREQDDPEFVDYEFIPSPELKIFKRFATEFGLFKSRKMGDLIDKLKQIDIKRYEDNKCPIRGENFYEIVPSEYYYRRVDVKIGYKKGATLEDFLKDIGIKDPMKWWETLE